MHAPVCFTLPAIPTVNFPTNSFVRLVWLPISFVFLSVLKIVTTSSMTSVRLSIRSESSFHKHDFMSLAVGWFSR